MTDELLDYVDENDNIIGQVLRSEMDEKKLTGRISAILVFNSQGRIMFCQNSENKDGAGKWKFSAMGHIAAGETPEIGAIREAEEEIGIKLKPEDLTKLFSYKFEKERVSRFIHVFKTTHDGPFSLDPHEYQDYKFLTAEEVDNILTTTPQFFSRSIHSFWKLYNKAQP